MPCHRCAPSHICWVYISGANGTAIALLHEHCDFAKRDDGFFGACEHSPLMTIYEYCE